MGDTITHTGWFRTIIFLVLMGSITLSISFFFPVAKKLLSSYSIDYYEYTPEEEVVSQINTSLLPPAEAVPILMYHGVIEEKDDFNTTLENFIAHMEYLKRNGYETITVEELDLWREGKFELPPKPIIITFDDGRKDSFYTTDDILKKLGFKATLFFASGPTDRGNPFYLTWKELVMIRDTGRWEIEAHGRFSHERIPVTPGDTELNDEDGRYLMSKMYLEEEGRLETDEEYKVRVEEDYLKNIVDLKEKLGIEARYFAVPLNDYGHQRVSNYPAAWSFNRSLLEKYFRLAFVQANDSDDVTRVALSVYNYKEDDPYFLRRIEMKNMSVGDLDNILRRYAPKKPSFYLTTETLETASIQEQAFEGNVSTTKEGILLRSSGPNEIGQLILGDIHWRNYTLDALLKRQSGRTSALIFNYTDDKNYMAFGLSDNGFFLRSTVDGVTKNVRMSRYEEVSKDGFLRFTVRLNGDNVDCLVNNLPLYSGISIPHDHGFVGVKIWHDVSRAETVIRSLEVTSR